MGVIGQGEDSGACAILQFCADFLLKVETIHWLSRPASRQRKDDLSALVDKPGLSKGSGEEQEDG